MSNFCDKSYVFVTKKGKNTTTTKQKSNIKTLGGDGGLNQEHLAEKADALPLHHRVN